MASEVAKLTAEALRSPDCAFSATKATKAAWDAASVASTAASAGATLAALAMQATELTVQSFTTAGQALTAVQSQAMKTVGQASGSGGAAELKVMGGVVIICAGLWDVVWGIEGLVAGHGHQNMMTKIKEGCDKLLAVLKKGCDDQRMSGEAKAIQAEVDSIRSWIRVHNGSQGGARITGGVAGITSGILLLLAPVTWGATLIPAAVTGGIAATTTTTSAVAKGFVDADHAKQLEERLAALQKSLDSIFRKEAAGNPSLAQECPNICKIKANRMTLAYTMTKGKDMPRFGDPPRGDTDAIKKTRFPRWYRASLIIDDCHRCTTPWYDNYAGLEKEMVQLDRGHIVPAKLGGSGSFVNLFAQNRKQNRGAWRREEEKMVNLICEAREGAKIEWSIDLVRGESHYLVCRLLQRLVLLILLCAGPLLRACWPTCFEFYNQSCVMMDSWVTLG